MQWWYYGIIGIVVPEGCTIRPVMFSFLVPHNESYKPSRSESIRQHLS